MFIKLKKKIKLYIYKMPEVKEWIPCFKCLQSDSGPCSGYCDGGEWLIADLTDEEFNEYNNSSLNLEEFVNYLDEKTKEKRIKK